MVSPLTPLLHGKPTCETGAVNFTNFWISELREPQTPKIDVNRVVGSASVRGHPETGGHLFIVSGDPVPSQGESFGMGLQSAKETKRAVNPPPPCPQF